MTDSSAISEAAGRAPVTPGDVEAGVALAIAAFRRAPDDADWSAKAGTLDWTCWETAEHLVDDLFAYAAQLGSRTPGTGHDVGYWFHSRRDGGPANAIFVDRAAGTDGLFAALESTAGMLAALVTVRRPEVRSFHVYGVSDPEGFAAMGLVETLVHAHDIGAGLGVDFTPPADLCDRALARLFPEAPADQDRWQTLLWATGRGDLPGRERRGDGWRWHGKPLA